MRWKGLKFFETAIFYTVRKQGKNRENMEVSMIASTAVSTA